MMFSDSQIKTLRDPLNPANVKPRKGPNGMTVSYIEGWQVIDEANAIFGFGNWSREPRERQGGLDVLRQGQDHGVVRGRQPLHRARGLRCGPWLRQDGRRGH
jgi:Rad52/22 family double-strand break repair protein